MEEKAAGQQALHQAVEGALQLEAVGAAVVTTAVNETQAKHTEMLAAEPLRLPSMRCAPQVHHGAVQARCCFPHRKLHLFCIFGAELASHPVGRCLQALLRLAGFISVGHVFRFG